MSYWFVSKGKEAGFDAERSPRAEVERSLGLGADSLPALVMDRLVVRDILLGNENDFWNSSRTERGNTVQGCVQVIDTH